MERSDFLVNGNRPSSISSAVGEKTAATNTRSIRAAAINPTTKIQSDEEQSLAISGSWRSIQSVGSVHSEDNC